MMTAEKYYIEQEEESIDFLPPPPGWMFERSHMALILALGKAKCWGNSAPDTN